MSLSGSVWLSEVYNFFEALENCVFKGQRCVSGARSNGKLCSRVRCFLAKKRTTDRNASTKVGHFLQRVFVVIWNQRNMEVYNKPFATTVV